MMVSPALLLALLAGVAASADDPPRVGGAIHEPRKIINVNPEYPDEARKTRIQDVVFLDCIVGKDGTVTEARVLRGDPVLAEAARSAVLQWTYTPTLLNGEPVAITMTVSVNYVLRNGSVDGALIKALKDENPVVRERAAVVCGSSPWRTRALEDALRQAARDPEEKVREAAARALKELRKR